jgi:hypothetical protein
MPLEAPHPQTRRIVIDLLDGMRVVDVAKKYKLSRQRVSRIKVQHLADYCTVTKTGRYVLRVDK